MNSPGRISPFSESSSDSPDVEIEEFTSARVEPTAFTMPLVSSSSIGNVMAPKRRLPGNVVFVGMGSRDTKSRRRELRSGGGGGIWEQGGPGSSRNQRSDDLVDPGLVDALRAQFGDPFDETPLKNASEGN